MGASSRTKGASGEREFAGLLHDHLGVRLVRNLEQSRSGGHDLITHPDEAGPVADMLRRYAIEVKRYSKPTDSLIARWWRQAEQQAQEVGALPCLAYRGNRAAWRVVVPLAALMDTITDDGLTYAATLGLEGFCALVREG